MKTGKKFIWLILSSVMVLSLVLSACAEEATPTPTATAPAPTATAPAPTATAPAPTATAPAPTAPAPTATAPAEANWWDKLGEPEYGGTLTCQATDLTGLSFDPSTAIQAQYCPFWFESLFQPAWTVDPDIWTYNTGFIDTNYLRGALAESWEQSEPLTVTVYLRQGVHWQDRPPVNGREFTADDVQYSYDWILGTGSGFTEPHLFWAGTVPNIERVVATDKYTVQFKLKEPVATAIYQVLEAAVSLAFPIVPHEWVEQGDLQNWKNAVGTGPWIPTDYIVGTSIALSRNPNYWGYDERHPENQLPYADTYKVIAIPDVATSLAALRTGKVDVVTGGRAGVSWQQGASLARTNPEIEQALSPNPGFSLDLRCDTKPFTDIRVRKALQMALDLKSMAKALYGGTVDGTPCGVVNPMYKEWITPYDEWPEELKAEYSFNPEQARELLAEAGYPNGFKTDCVASTDDNMELLQAIKSYFKDIGVDMDIRAMEGYACQAFCQAGKHDQMVFTHGTSMHFGPVESTRYRRSTNTRDNYTFNNDPHYDALVEQLDTATTLDEAKQISFEANLYLLEQHWAVQTFPTAKVTVWQSYLKGYLGENLNPPYPAFVPTRLWIDQELKKSMGY